MNRILHPDKLIPPLSSEKIDSRSFLFISATNRAERPILDPSTRYRCYHPAEALTSLGHYAGVVSLARFLETPCYDYDAYVFHRPSIADKRFLPVLAKLRESAKILVADYDDLIFGDEEIALESSIAKNLTLSPEATIAVFRNNLEALRSFETITASTRPLAIAIKDAHPIAAVEVCSNTVPDSVIQLCDALQPFDQPRNSDVGYFCGTRSHNLDFPEVYDVLLRLIQERSSLHLWIFGPLDLHGALAAQPRVHFRPVVGYWRLFNQMSRCHITIAPLEPSPFNACKSRVKFLESGLSGCELIASPIDDMTLLVDAGVRLASTEDDWYNLLSNRLDHQWAIERAREVYHYITTRCNSRTAAHLYLRLAGETRK